MVLNSMYLRPKSFDHRKRNQTYLTVEQHRCNRLVCLNAFYFDICWLARGGSDAFVVGEENRSLLGHNWYRL